MVSLLIAVLGLAWRESVKPYLSRYRYASAHHARDVRRSLRDQIGNVRVVRSMNGPGYAARMSHMSVHMKGVYA